MFNHANATSKIFDRVHRTGEEIKNDLPNWIQRVVDEESWKQVANPATGKPFESVGEWLVANYPLGPGVGNGRYSIHYDELIVLCEKDRPELKSILVGHRPKRKAGRRAGDEQEPSMIPKAAKGTSKAYIEARLQRDHPEIWQRYIQGEFRSARAAGIEAGFIKVSSKLDDLKAKFSRASKREQQAFLKWANS